MDTNGLDRGLVLGLSQPLKKFPWTVQMLAAPPPPPDVTPDQIVPLFTLFGFLENFLSEASFAD